MPSPLAHLAAGYTLGRVFPLGPAAPARRRLIPAAMLCALAADLDCAGFAFGVRVDSLWGHRGILHSLVGALGLAVLGYFLFVARRFRRPGPAFAARATLALLAATLSHPLLDLFTDTPYGVALLAPFSEARFTSLWRPLPDPPDTPAWYVSADAWRILSAELLWVVGPCLPIVAFVRPASEPGEPAAEPPAEKEAA